MIREVGFYHLTVSTLETALPQLLEKVIERGLRAVLVAGDQQRLSALDRHLWTYRTDSFLPHGTARADFAERQPILLSDRVENPNGASVLVLVDGTMPEPDAPFARCVDLFDGADGQALDAARRRWKAWRERDVTLTYWQQTERGGWTKAHEVRGHEIKGAGDVEASAGEGASGGVPG